jgi:hypothetical protein
MEQVCPLTFIMERYRIMKSMLACGIPHLLETDDLQV